MWSYEKRLQYPVNIKNPNPAAAKIIISQLGGPDGEMAASMRYLNQRYTAPCREVQGLLNDIGTEAPEMFFSGLSLSKKPPERVAFLSQIWYNEKGDKNAAKG